MTHIPNELFDLVVNSEYAKKKQEAEEAEAERKRNLPRAGEWMVYAEIPASNGHSVHTVSIFVNHISTPPEIEWKCTCQSFRIQKNECKHIVKAKSDYDEDSIATA